jgi:MYXO-CTERM domain-containing protein
LHGSDRARRGEGSMMKRIDWIVILAAAAAAYGCGGAGCDGMVPTPGGFPATERTNNAGQIRITPRGLAAITDDPAAILGGLLPGGLSIDVPAGCGGEPAICCPGGTPQSPCGPLVIDLEEQAGDTPRMEIHPVAGQSRLDVIVRARLHTVMDLPVDDIPLIGDCSVAIDTEPGDDPDVQINLPIRFTQDNVAGTTRVEAGDATLANLTTDDVSINGGGLCFLADLGIGLFLDTLTSQFTDQIKSALDGALCKACDSGDVADCGQFADACTDNTCARADGSCLQELGLAGRLVGNKLLGNASPGTTGGFDVYEVAGGYATTNQNGISLGLLGGMLPAGEERDRCGPPATPPGDVNISQSTYFQNNSRPDTGAQFGLGIGIHQSQLDNFAYAAYDGGFLCLTIGTRTIDLLTTDTITLIAGSLGDLITESSPVALGLRPQRPPTFTLGLNTFIDNGGEPEPDDPLLDILFEGMEIDFFASIDGHYVRIFTLVADIHLPIGLQVADGELVPVIGAVDDAFTNLSVKNSEALVETPEELATRFPTILQLALPQLGGALGGFALPELAGLQLNVTEITAVDNRSFLAIYADLAPVGAVARVETVGEVVAVHEPDSAILNDASRWTRAGKPSAVVKLAGEDGLEWQLRADDGLWSPWSTKRERTVSPPSFWLQGTHRIEVRARKVGQDATIDRTPLVLEVPIGSVPLPVDQITASAKTGGAGFHGQAGESGCDCSTGSPANGAPLAIVLFALLVPWRRAKARVLRARRGLPPWMWIGAVVVAFVGGPGCSCSSSPPCGDLDCMEGEVEHSSGKWNGAATDGTRTVVSTYDPELGDLVVADVAGSEYTMVAVDGIPDETPVYDPSTYRGGITGPGPNVGAWSSIALTGGDARVAYQDRDTGGLKVAIEHENLWTAVAVDDRGMHTSIAVDAAGNAVVAYLAVGVADGAGGIKSELRVARATKAIPDDFDWSIAAIAEAPASCGGFCAAGQACLAGTPEVCVTPTNDCASDCGDDQVCSAGACVDAVADPSYVDLPTGTGLFPTALVLSDGRVAVVYYDRVRTALVLLLESSAGAGTYAETILDGADDSDRGMWASAVTDGTAIHVAYQDALGDQVYYTSWSGGAGTPELVDDGVRPGDRTHPVGAGASIYFAGGEPAIAYQDGMVADIVVAHRSGGAWTTAPLSSGATLDGFHIAATASVVVWDQLSHERAPADELVTAAAP